MTKDEAPVQEPDLIARLKHPEDHYEFTDPKKANAVLMSLCQEAADALAAPVQEPVQEPVAQAWDEGYRAGIDDERTSEANIGIAGFGAKVEPARNNPYRATLPKQPAPVQPVESPDDWSDWKVTPPAAQPSPDRTGMTYYRNGKCKALNAASHDCICWTPAAQPAPVQEPVAWPMEEQPDGSIIPVDPSELPSDYFTTPPAAPELVAAMAQILGDRLAKEQAVYLSMETAKSFVKSMLAAAPEKWSTP